MGHWTDTDVCFRRPQPARQRIIDTCGTPHGFRNDAALPAPLPVIARLRHQALEMFRHFDRDSHQSVPATLPAIAGQYGVRFV